MDKYDPKWNTTSWKGYDNYWAGAKKACEEQGMSLPDKSKLQSIYEAGKKDSSLGLPTSGWFWSSSEYDAGNAYDVYFGNGGTYTSGKEGSPGKVLCVGDQKKSIGLGVIYRKRGFYPRFSIVNYPRVVDYDV